MTETHLDLPLLPLRDTVILPTMMVPLFIGRRKSVAAVEQALAGDGTIFLAAQRSGQLINPEKDDLFAFGCVGEITDRVQLPDKSIKVMVEGRQRAHVLEFLEVEPSFLCRVATSVVAPDDLEASQARYPALLERFKALAAMHRRMPPEALRPFEAPDDVSAAVDMMIATLSLRFQDRQDLLEMTRLIERVERVADLVTRESEAVEAEQRLRSRRSPVAPKRKPVPPNREPGASSSDAAQQAEAADEFKNELAELEEKLAKKSMPDYARERGRRELKKLRMMSPMSAEATVVRNYLDWVVTLPWDEVTKDKLDIADAEKVLDEDHHGLEKVKERILEYLAVQELVKELRGPILCFVGPPGVGKTSLARSIARATGRTYVRLSLGGVRDEAEIRGHRRTYIGAFPGKIIQSLKRAGSSNPVLLLDEVDKMSMDFRGDPAAALLEVLDPEQNASFLDHYLDVDYDLSRVLFITTANSIHGIPAPLLDRMEVIQLPGYTELEKVQIARQFLFPKQRKENGLSDVEVRLPETTLRFLVNGYTREAGVRNLERELGAVLRKIAVDVVRSGGVAKGRAYRVTPAMVKGFLGEPRFRDAKAEEHDEIGAATGLAVTYAGGDILGIEVTLMPGAGKLTITGKLGDVMQESAQAAMSYVRAHAAGLGLDRAFYQKVDVHIHVPEGAIPKDGPSAGITIATALASAVARVPVRRDVAMTGEITLRGRVLPIGGVKEKLLAASRSGYTTVIVPSENLKDLKDVPKAVRSSLDIVLASTMDDVLKKALVPDPRLTFPLAASQSELDEELRGKAKAARKRP